MEEHITKELEKEVEEMIETWDIVKCKYCGKEISMLTNIMITTDEGYEYFVCKEH